LSNPAVDLHTLVRHLTRPRPNAIFVDGDPMVCWKIVRNSEKAVDDEADESYAKSFILLQHCQGTE